MPTHAFVLGAGLGTRLRPLTDLLPKPMIPVWNKPLISWAFDHLISGGFSRFMVNTHHLPEAYDTAFPDHHYRGCPLEFRHEPVLLETGGGIANIADWLPREDSFIVYNGDILSDLPLQKALDHHLGSRDLVTMVLRSRGSALQVSWDEKSGLVTDIGGRLDPGATTPRFQFTGIYLVRPAFLELLTPGKKESVIPAFLQTASAHLLGGVVIDEGRWSDLGDRPSYLAASLALGAGDFPRYDLPEAAQAVRIHPKSRIAPTAQVCPLSSVGPDCVVEAHAQVERSILWPGIHVPAGTVVTGEVLA